MVRNLGVVFGQRSQLTWDLRLGETFERLNLFTFLLPLAWMTFWPVKDMLGLGGFAIPVPLALVTLVVGLVMFAGSCVVFRIGMGRYESAGS